MTASDWIQRGVSLLRTGTADEKAAAAAPAAARKGGEDTRAPRTLAERMEATLRRHGEALPPRALRKALEDMRAVIDPRVSEVEGGRRASALAQEYAGLSPDERRDWWLLICECFAPDARRLQAAREQFEAAQPGSPEYAQAEVKLRRALLSPRARLLQRFSMAAEGMRFLIELRAELLPEVKKDRRLSVLDAELEQLFSTWFDVAFLELQRISWDSPASLIEKLIQYEAVHDIKSWSDVKNRLDERDRRCYGFFHPRLPGVPLIFVEVALTEAVSDSITPLLDEQASADARKADTAIFYSISNTQTGLRGVSFGDSLIKRVVETLREEFPKLKTFATLSPIPGLRGWLSQNAQPLLDRLPERQAQALGRLLGAMPPTAQRLIAALDEAQALGPKSPLRQWLMQAAAEYLGRGLREGKPIDAVARFHLGNGARVERLNWAADPSAKGQRQSWGLMVNYLYDLKRLDKHRALLAQGKVPVSGDVEGLFLKAAAAGPRETGAA
ncbi:malonyl-CoA decarboxylase [Xenophilus sp. Marseille-Q4582]|uniref:malonyl-CoA decarboxylase n=1 Tax=Xenophilus sp. Marseille-Q4582 TaxID=2866600 RepID=UPI001CE3D48E|nr:malonyl-CoA decarboxylase [Xenophilus sp. Marseille-Q4582]